MIAGFATIVVGALALLGWLLNWKILTQFGSSAESMKPDTAVAFILAGAALELRNQRAPNRRERAVAMALAWLVAAIGMFTLLSYGFDGSVGHQEMRLFFPRMAPATALALSLLGAALVVMAYANRLATLIYQSCLLLGFVVGLVVVIGYCYGIADLYQFAGYRSVAPSTAFGLLLLATGAFWARPGRGGMREFTSNYPGAQTARRVWFPTIVSLFLFGGALKWGVAHALLSDTAGDIFFLLGSLAIVTIAIWFSTRALNRSHLRILHRDRLYAVLSQTNGSIVRLKEPDELFAHICRIATTSGQFRSAWIGLIDPRTESLALVTAAHAGAPISEVSRELASRAIRERKPAIANAGATPSVAGSPVLNTSDGAFLLTNSGRPAGVLVVESSETGYFESGEIDLLSEVAADVSFALEMMERESQRLAIERAMRESQERLELATAAAKIGFWDWDLVTDEVKFSREWQKQLGVEDADPTLTRDEVQGRLHPDDRPRVQHQLQEFLQGGARGAYSVEYRLRHKDGSYRWIYSRARAFHGLDDRPLRMVGWHVDVTAQKNAEAAVREREARLQTVVENLTEGLIISESNGQVISWNRAALEMHGFESNEGLLRRLADFTNIYQLSALDGRVLGYDEWPMPRIFRGELVRGLELRIRRLDTGWSRIFSYGGTLVQNGNGSALAFLTVTDVTERNLAETAVRESEGRFRELADHVDEVFWITDPLRHKVLYVSPAYEKIWGRNCDELYGDPRNWLVAVHRDDQERVRHAVATRQERGEYDETFRIIRPDGSVRWVRDRAFPVRNGGGHVYRIVGTAQDITARKVAEIRQELQHAVTTVFAEARSLNEAAGKVIALVCRTMEWSVGELWMLDRPSARLRCKESYHAAGGEFAEFVAHTRELVLPAGVGLPGRIWLENQPLWIEDLATEETFVRGVEAGFAGLHGAFGFPVTLRDEVVGVLLFFSHHIHEPDEEMRTLASHLGSQLGQFIQRTQLEEQFRQAQKMEAIGQLAGGVAHDFNNVLTVIKAYPQLIAMTPGLSAETHEWLEHISDAADRAAGLTRQLLAFSRKQVMQIQSLVLNDVVEGMSSMLRRIIGEDIALAYECGHALPAIEADSGMMEQVLLNLVVNARDAMPRGGKLTISTRLMHLDAGAVRDRPRARPGEFVALSVADTGSGMTPEIMAHIFEPFFTTKGPGKGTGLGLATVYGIAEQHHGWVEAESQVGQGATFTVFLPPAATVAPALREKSYSLEMPRGRETILLVEDEPAVRMLSKVVLERLGYRVFDAVSGLVALEVWQEHQQEIDLLVTDMVMPQGVNGRDLATRLRQQNPNLRVLFTTGYSPANVAQGLNLLEGLNFVQKPYLPQVLSEAVRKCLERPPEPLS